MNFFLNKTLRRQVQGLRYEGAGNDQNETVGPCRLVEFADENGAKPLPIHRRIHENAVFQVGRPKTQPGADDFRRQVGDSPPGVADSRSGKRSSRPKAHGRRSEARVCQQGVSGSRLGAGGTAAAGAARRRAAAAGRGAAGTTAGFVRTGHVLAEEEVEGGAGVLHA